MHVTFASLLAVECGRTASVYLPGGPWSLGAVWSQLACFIAPGLSGI